MELCIAQLKGKLQIWNVSSHVLEWRELYPPSRWITKWLITSVWPSVWGWNVVLCLSFVSIIVHRDCQEWLGKQLLGSDTTELGNPNMLEELVCRFFTGDCLLTWYEYHYFWKMIHHHEKIVITSMCFWKTSKEIHKNALGRTWRNRQRSV